MATAFPPAKAVPARNAASATGSRSAAFTSQHYDRPVESSAPATIGRVATETLRADLERAFPDATELSVVDRTGTGDHFQVTVSSRRFQGLSLVEQHKLVYDALAGPLADGTIHELRIKTR
jgi:stress-induced morphogen